MRSLIIAMFSVFLLFSCNSNIVVSDSKSLDNTWHKDDVIEFKLPVLDSLTNYNIFINIRNTNDYNFNNLYLITTMEFPHGKFITDTLEYKMAATNGEWLGTGIGSVKENKLWYKEKITFSEVGIYKLKIAHAVRNNGDVDGVSNLDGIADVGYSIELPVQHINNGKTKTE